MTNARFRWSRFALLVAPAALAAAVLAAQPASPPASTANPPRTQPAAQDKSPYAADPNDLWNRLHRTLFVNAAPAGSPYHQSDPLLLAPKDYFLGDDTHRAALAVIDEFLAAPRAQAARQAIHRLFLQHDLWAAFDDVAWRPDNWVHFEKDEPAAIALRTRLARAIKILALSDRELDALPDNYAQAVKTSRFAKTFDPAKPDRAFLPDDLFDPRGPWVAYEHYLDAPMAASHFEGCGGRAVHIVLLNLPGGRAITEKYLAELSSPPKNLPAGTMAALVRQTLTIDQHGNPRLIPLTESVQIRVYLEVADVPSDHYPERQQGGRQSAFEFVLERSELSRGNDGLRSVGPEEPRFVFSRNVQGHNPNQMSTCIECHGGSGVYSMQSLMRHLADPQDRTTFRPFSWEVLVKKSTIAKTKQFNWGLLQGILEGQSASQ